MFGFSSALFPLHSVVPCVFSFSVSFCVFVPVHLQVRWLTFTAAHVLVQPPVDGPRLATHRRGLVATACVSSPRDSTTTHTQQNVAICSGAATSGRTSSTCSDRSPQKPGVKTLPTISVAYCCPRCVSTRAVRCVTPFYPQSLTLARKSSARSKRYFRSCVWSSTDFAAREPYPVPPFQHSSVVLSKLRAP